MKPIRIAVALTLATFALPGCGGTILTEFQGGYALAPTGEELGHSGSLAGHVGGSSAYGLGIGLSARARAMNQGFVFPEAGPHIFLLAENDTPIAFYVRANAFVGFGMLEGEIGPVFSPVLNPGIIWYPADDPTFLSLSLTADMTLAPVGPYARPWFGIQFGFGAGGTRYDARAVMPR